MDLKLKRQGFAFIFLTLFVSFFMFTFAVFLLSPNNFNSEESFTNARISQLSSEINYFEESYLPTATSYALFNIIDALLEYSRNKTNYINISNNYGHLNELIYEGMTNASFDSKLQTRLINVSLKAFLDSYEVKEEELLNLNFTYKINDIIVYEKDPFYITVQVSLDFQVETQDNISYWDRSIVYEVSVPIFNFDDPQFIIQENKSILIRPIGQFASNIEWDLNLLNETINKTYSVVYLEPTHDYTIGSSFLRRFLNESQGSFKDVLLRYSFDFDDERGPVYDSIQKNKKGDLFGDTLLLMDFDNQTLGAKDISSYNNSVIVNGALWDNTNCQNLGCYSFNGVDNYINISHSKNFNFENESFSINMWLNSNGDLLPQGIIKKSEIGGLRFELSWNLNNTIDLFLDDSVNTIIEKTQSNYTKNSWHMISIIFNPGYESYIYVDGKNELKIDTSVFNNFTNKANFQIGKGDINNFNGLIDEVSIYHKSLSPLEVAVAYSNLRAKFIEYEDSLYGSGVRFDGKDDYINISNKEFNLSTINNLTLSSWIYPISYTDKVSNLNSTIFNYGDSSTDLISISFNNLGNLNVELGDHVGGAYSSYKSTNKIVLNEWTYIVVSIDGNLGELKIYINGLLDSQFNFPLITSFISSTKNIGLGTRNKTILEHYSGIIDEFVAYNRTLSSQEVKDHFYNYRSTVKGCCNYITLIDPNSLGYNDLVHTENVSYSSKLFYDNYNMGIKNKLTLYNITNLTSSSTSKKYFNFMLDLCLTDAYNVFSYNDSNQPTKLVQSGDYGASCSGLVEAGIY